MLRLDFVPRGSFSQPALAELSKLVRKNADCFFKYPPEPLEGLRFVAFEAANGGDAQSLIKKTHLRPEFGRNPVGVPVVMYTEGTQGVLGLLQVVGKTDTETAELIASGPYRRKPKAQPQENSALPECFSHEAREASPPTSVSGEVGPEIPPLPPLEEPPQVVESSSLKLVGIPPRAKLEELGIPGEEIKRLEATLASIIVRVHGSHENVPSLLRVPVRVITQAIMEHMKLPTNSRNNYQGIIGSFYSSKISLFGLKYDYGDKADPNEQYPDWLLDSQLILDFIGGSDKLPHLVRERDAEVAERLLEESKPKEVPPTAAQVEEVVLERFEHDGFAADAEILETASRMLLGRREAEVRLDQALVNERGMLAEVERLQVLLKVAEGNLEQAVNLRVAAQLEVEQFTLPEDIRQKVLKVKSRLDALMRDLGVADNNAK